MRQHRAHWADILVADTYTAARIKKTVSTKPGAPTVYKFKIRCATYLYTLVVRDAEKADKLKQSLPPSAFTLLGSCPRRLTLFAQP